MKYNKEQREEMRQLIDRFIKHTKTGSDKGGAVHTLTDQRKRSFLREEGLLEPEPLKTGVWYKDDAYPKVLIFAERIGIEIGDNFRVYGYGFTTSGNWKDEYFWEHTENEPLRPAPEEEVKEALIAEAKRRGYTKTNHDCFIGGGYNKMSGWAYYLETNRLFTANYGGRGSCIFYNGKWATIIDEEETKPEEYITIEGKTYNCRTNVPEIEGYEFHSLNSKGVPTYKKK